MRPIHLFIVGLLFLGVTLFELGFLFFRIFPPRANDATSIPGEALELPAETVTPVAPLDLPRGSTIQHHVAPGEWLVQIARCYGVSYQNVRIANPQLTDPDGLPPGMVITVPNIGSAGRIYGPPCIKFHTVQRGDTWASLAQKYNADILVMQTVNCALVIGQVLKIPLNSGSAPPGSPPPDPSALILLPISADSPSVTQSGTLPAQSQICFGLDARQGQTLEVKVAADADSKIGVYRLDEPAIQFTGTAITWSETVPQTARYRVEIASTSRDAVIRYILEAKITTSPSATATPSFPPTKTPKATVTPGGPTRTPIPSIRIAFGPGQITSVQNGVINPNEVIQYSFPATQGQVLSIKLTGPANEVAIGVIAPTGLTLKPLESTPTWSTTITTNGDYRIDIASLIGTSPIPYTLEVTLTLAIAPTQGLATGTPVRIPPTLVPSPAPTIMIEAEWPKRLEVGHADTIRVSLIRISGNTYLVTAETAEHTLSAATAMSIGTPDVGPERAFGPGYDAVAIAHIGGVAFQIDPSTDEEQRLDPDRDRIDWRWNIKPLVEDEQDLHITQVVGLTIDVQWIPRSSADVTIQRTLWHSDLHIDVYRPLIATGQLSLFTLLSGSIGSGLSIPFLYGIVKERKKKTQPKPKRKSPRS